MPVGASLRVDLLIKLSKAADVGPSDRPTAAQVATRFDAAKGTRALADLAESTGGFSLRMEAISSIPNRQRKATLYSMLAGGGFNPTDRLTAAKRAADHGTMAPLRKLAADPTAGRQVRRAAQDEVGKKTRKTK